MFGIPDFVVKPLIGFLAIAAAMIGVYFAWEHYVAKPYIEQGKAIGRSEMLPTIENLKLRLDADIEAFQKINGYFVEINAGSARIQKQLDKANAQNATRVQATKARIEYIDRIVPVGATECEKTADAVAKVFR